MRHLVRDGQANRSRITSGSGAPLVAMSRSVGRPAISPLSPRSDIADEVRRFQRGDIAPRCFEADLPQGHDLAGPAAATFFDSGQEPVLPFVEFERIRVIHRVAIRAIYRVISPVSGRWLAAGGLACSISSPCRSQRIAMDGP